MSRFHVDPLDAIALAGLLVLACGVALVYVPAALIVVGSALLLYTILATRSGGTS